MHTASGAAFLLSALLVTASVAPAAAEVNLNINLGPPPIAVAAPPEVVLVPGSQVYFVPGVSFDVFYYGGYWWSPRGDRWYRSPAYNGPWRGVSRRYVPAPIFRVPRDYQRVYYRERHIPYGQWKKERSEHREGRPGRGGEWRGGPGDRGEHRGDGGEHGRGEHGEHGRGER
ncbi:hypothetical protein JFN93_09765 [Geomonas sp. Red875]|uniref:YXWGXW repeat-containing protein n=2 Tax=Geomesophilobacter sediminis TaxID=2798584 RepID=A0A8J7LUS5_9BACT|nr:hypothetical protein [Geomesophilobacter sediminis]